MTRGVTGLVLATLSALSLDACSSGASPESEIETCEPRGASISIVAENFHFDRGCLAVRAGEPIHIELRNDDYEPHNFAVFDREAAKTHNLLDALSSVSAQPLERQTQTWDAIEAGTYTFLCTIHPSTMNGTFIVR